MVEQNYFVCTLGDAARINPGRSVSYDTVSGFLDWQATTNPDYDAVAFPLPPLPKHNLDEEWTYVKFCTGEQNVRGYLEAYSL